MRLVIGISLAFFVAFGSLLLFTDLCIACGCVVCFNPDHNSESNPAKEPVFMQLSPQDFSSKLSEDVILIDIRTFDEFNSGHIASAKNIDFYSASFISELDLLDKNKTYLIYCRTASRTSKAINVMKNLGFSEVYELSGGINNWAGSGFPVQ